MRKQRSWGLTLVSLEKQPIRRTDNRRKFLHAANCPRWAGRRERRALLGMSCNWVPFSTAPAMDHHTEFVEDARGGAISEPRNNPASSWNRIWRPGNQSSVFAPDDRNSHGARLHSRSRLGSVSLVFWSLIITNRRGQLCHVRRPHTGGALRFGSSDEYLRRTARDLRCARESRALSSRIGVDSNQMELRLTHGSTKCSKLGSARRSCSGYSTMRSEESRTSHKAPQLLGTSSL